MNTKQSNKLKKKLKEDKLKKKLKKSTYAE